MISFAPTIAREFIQSRLFGRYLRLKQLPILASVERPCTAFVAKLVAVRPMAMHTLETGKSDSEVFSRWAAT